MAGGLILALLLLAPSLAWADPGSLIATAIGLKGVAAAVTAFAINIGFRFALTAQQKRKVRKQAARQRAADNAGLSDRTVNLVANDAPLTTIYGSPAPVGVYPVASLESGDKDQFKHIVCVIAHHSCNSIEEVYLDGVPVGPLDANGWCTQGEFFEDKGDVFVSTNLTFDATGTAPKPANLVSISMARQTDIVGTDDPIYTDYNLTITPTQLTGGPPNGTIKFKYVYRNLIPRVNIQKHLGATPDVADAFLMNAAPTKWTAAHKLSGITYIVLTLDLNMARFQGGPPAITVKVFGKNTIHDFQTLGAGYSTNAVRCLADYLRTAPGGSADLAQFDGSWAVHQAIAEEFAYPAPPETPPEPYEAWFKRTGGERKRFVVHARITADESREQVLEQFEAAIIGQIAESAGVLRVRTGVWTTPVDTITEADCLGDVLQMRGGYDGSEVYNTARAQYLDRLDARAVPVDAKPYVNSTFLAADGEESAVEPALGFVGDATRAQQAMRVMVEQSRGGQLLRYPGGLRLWRLQPGDRVILNHAPFGILGKTYRIVSKSFGIESPVVLELLEDEASFYDQADEVNPLVAPNGNLSDPLAKPNAPVITGIASGGALLQRAGDGSVISRARVTWASPTSPYIQQGGQVRLQYQLSDAPQDQWIDGGVWPGSDVEAMLSSLPDGDLIIVRLRFENERGIPSDWAYQSHIVIGKTEPPSDVQSLALTITSEGIRSSWQRPADVDYALTHLKRGSAWDSATDDLGPSGTPMRRDATSYLHGWLPAGVFSVVAKHEDTSGNPSALAMSASLTVRAPSRVSFSRVVPIDNRVLFVWQDAFTDQPIKRYQYRFSSSLTATWETATPRGASGGAQLSDIIEFDAAGTYLFFIAAEDFAGNLGVPESVQVSVVSPPGFVIRTSGSSTLVGSYTNAARSDLGYVDMLVNTTETYAQHFDTRGWLTTQDQVNAGFPLYYQPGMQTARFEQVIDLGAVVTSSTISFSIQGEWVAGSGSVQGEVAYSTTGLAGSWTVLPNTFSAVGNNFRYVRLAVVVAAVNASGLHLYRLTGLQYQVSVREVTENVASFTSNAADASGTLYQNTKGLLDITGMNFTPSGGPFAVSVTEDATVSPIGVRVRVWNSTTGARVTATGPLSLTGITT